MKTRRIIGLGILTITIGAILASNSKDKGIKIPKTAQPKPKLFDEREVYA